MKKVAIYLAFALVITTVVASDIRTPGSRRPIESLRPMVSPGLSTPVDPADPESMRQLMVSWAQTMEATYGQEPRASRAFAEMNGALVHAWYNMVDDPARLASALSLDMQVTLQGREAEQVAAAQGTLFSPDYPPSTGKYKTWVLDTTEGLATIGSERCDTIAWADKYEVWVLLDTVLDGIEIACIVGGCDPSGIACAAACLVVEGARIAEKVARLPIDACVVHDGNVDAAEIEACYENTRTITSDVENSRSQIISNANTNRDTILNNDNNNRDTIIVNDNVNRDILLAQFTGQLERSVLDNLSKGLCEHWMYTPMYADAAQTIPLGGQLEVTVALVQTVIDQAQILGSEAARIDAAQGELDSVLPLAQDRPLEAELICRHLEEAYINARMLPLRATP